MAQEESITVHIRTLCICLVFLSALALATGCQDAPPEPSLTFSPALILYGWHPPDGAPRRLRPGEVVQAGDQVQVEVLPAGWPYGVVASLDGRGRATLHYPDSPQGSTRLPAVGVLRLPWAFALDDAPGFERFVLVTSTAPLPVEAALEAVRRAGEGKRPGVGDDAASFILYKAPQRLPR